MKLASPLAFVVAVPPLTVAPAGPPAITAFTVTLAWPFGFPLASRSCTAGCCVKIIPACAATAGCVVSVSWVTSLAIPVATNVIGFPAIPLPAAVAVRAFDPAPAPSVQLPAVATPFAPVVGVAPVTPPPPAVTPNVTPTPATGLPD